MVGEAISEILGSTDSVRITVSFGFADGAINRMKITTDIDEQLNDRIGEYALEQADKAAAEIESAFYDYIDEELEASDMLSDEISQQGREIVENIRNAEDLETAIEEQIEEQQAALKSRAQEEVEKQTEELKEKAKEGLEGLGEDLKLPGF
jgi:type I site-specific restriction-modification system R (restriction) subunit